MAEALDLALELKHPAYDCFYLALAIRQGTVCVTADTRFADAVRRRAGGRHVAHLVVLGDGSGP